MSPDAVKDRIRSAWEALWDRGELDAVDDLFGPGFTRTSRASGTAMTVEEFKDAVAMTRTAFPDLATEIDELLMDGDKVAIFWHSTGTHENEMFGVPATGKQVSTYGSNLALLADGQIVSELVTWDPRQLLQALGITALGDAL